MMDKKLGVQGLGLDPYVLPVWHARIVELQMEKTMETELALGLLVRNSCSPHIPIFSSLVTSPTRL